MMKLRLFLLSFLILFTELALIRWIPAYVRPVGYFSNLILLGAFLGMGVGLLWSHSRHSWFSLFPPGLLLLLVIISLLRVEVIINSPSEIFFHSFGSSEPQPPVNAQIILPFIFVLVSSVFALISQELGKALALFKPLTAYSLDIAGSLGGIAIFSLLSFQHTSAWVWFVVIGATAVILIKQKRSSLWTAGIGVLCLVAATILAYKETTGSLWSPYYKITVAQYVNGYVVNVNNMGHQFIRQWEGAEPFYSTVYNVFPKAHFRRILIIGAGSGDDVAIALAKNPGVERIDAVEIDPIILSLGQELNPDHPYANPKVHVTVKDGRNFLERSHEKYDLIIFALTDSVTLTSQMSAIRLESFLFTKESFQQVKNHLTDDGVFVLYNYYREQWLVDKIAGMLLTVFHMPVYARLYGDLGFAATLIAGPKTAELAGKSEVIRYVPWTPLSPATDDWPFIYLQTKELSPFYIQLILILTIISVVAVLPALVKRHRIQFNLRLFLFGAAFLLLETKNLVTFDLLFGATWYVNALVFTAILLSVLIANLISSRFSIRPLWILYVLLFTSLAFNAFFPTTTLFLFAKETRYALASLLYFAPIVIANLIFSQIFKSTRDSAIALGCNLLGAVFGGFLEYSALVVGYQALFVLTGILYMFTLFV